MSAAEIGSEPSHSPVRNTASHSRPLAAWTVLRATARAETLDDPGRARPDGDEIAQLRWVTRDELPAAGLRLPPAASIAAAMIAAWRAGAR